MTVFLSFDDILGLIGEMGPYQIKLMLLVCLSTLTEAMHSLMGVFITAELGHWCSVEEWQPSVDDCYTEYRDDDTDAYLDCIHKYRNSSIPRYLDDGDLLYEQCSKYDAEYPSTWYEGYYASNYTSAVIDCDEGWVYDRSQYKATIVNEFELVCDNQYLAATSQSLFYFGYLVGSFLSGSMADLIGRYKMFFLAIALTLVFGLTMSFATSYWFFASLYFLTGVSNISIYLMSFVIVTELVGPSKRVYPGIAIPIGFSFGSMILGLFAFFIRDWRNLQRIISICLLPLFLLIPVLPESARWLMAKNKFEETERILIRTAKGNNTSDKLPKDLGEQLRKQEEARKRTTRPVSFIDLVRTPVLRRRTILMLFVWFVNSLIYFGLSLNTASLGDNDYVTFFISAAVEVPANLLVIPLIQSPLGRRYSESGLLLVGGITCFTTSFLDNSTAITAVAMMGKFCITASYSALYIYSSEVFPTTHRAVGMGTCSTFARVGSILAPLMIVLGDVYDGLHLIIFGVLSILASLVMFLLPETRGKPLNGTVEDIEGTNQMEMKDVGGDIDADSSYEEVDGMPIVETIENKSKVTTGQDNSGYVMDPEIC